jgi:uncharacterized protein (DUF362 family)
MTRRDLLALAAAPALRAASAPTAPVAIARANSYDDDVTTILNTMFDQIGGLGRIVRNKTVTIKLNLTGNPGQRFMGRPVGQTHFTHPKIVMAAAQLIGNAGARRIRFVESAWASGGPLEEFMLDAGWNVRMLKNAAPKVEFENTNNLGLAKQYARLKVPGRPLMFPAYDLNHAYHDTDVFVSMAKLKNHEICGVTLSMKNCFGNTPASIYGDDAGENEPNEKPTSGRVNALHYGKRTPSKSAPQELTPGSSTDPGHRVPRIVADLVASRPIDLAVIDGIESVSGGEGPWIKGLKLVKPGLLIAGTNPVTTDAVATAAMGYDPKAPKGTKPFVNCDSTLLLAEQAGIGTADLKQIEVTGLSLDKARYPFG